MVVGLTNSLMTLCVAALGFLTSLAPAISQAQDRPQPKLPVTELRAGMHIIKAEVAATPAARATGMMWREVMGANEGMLFVFEHPSPQCFWMKNTLLPLSIAFIDDNGVIVNLADMKPRDETSHCSLKPVRFALEMNQGWFAKKGLKAGSRLSAEKIWGK